MSEVFERTFVYRQQDRICAAREIGGGHSDDSYSSTQAAYQTQLRSLPADHAVAAWASEGHVCTKAFTSAWPPPSVKFGGVEHESLQGHSNGTSEPGEPRVRVRGGHRIGSQRGVRAHQTPCRLHVPVFLVRTRMAKRFRRGNTMLYVTNTFTCKRPPSIPGRPSRDTLAEQSRRTRAPSVTGARCESLQEVACRAVANPPSS